MRIAILNDYQSVALEMADWSRIRAAHEVVSFNQHIADQNELAAKLGAVDIVCIMRERTMVDRALLEKLPTLKLIVTTGGAHAGLDVKAAAERGIVCCGTASSRFATAELTFGLILALARGIVPQHNAVRTGGWQLELGEDVNGKTLGIIGLGSLGAKVAGFGRAFGMIPIAWSQNLTDEQAKAGGAERVGKDELLARSDFVSIHYKLSARSHHIVGAAEIARMKKTAYLINTSRGPLIDELALITALHEGRIAGAGLDVFDQEPLPLHHPLRYCPRLDVTPHVGYASRENSAGYYREVVDDIEGWLAGKPVRVLKAG